MTIEQLEKMKSMAAERNNWKEVERINKMLDFNLKNYWERARATRVLPGKYFGLLIKWKLCTPHIYHGIL